jgi:glutathione synthase
LNKTGGGIRLPPSSDRDKASATTRLPKNQTIASLVSGLVAAHEAYGPPKSREASKTGILFIVQPRNMNICDERPLEYALRNHDPPIPAYRVIFGEDVLA